MLLAVIAFIEDLQIRLSRALFILLKVSSRDYKWTKLIELINQDLIEFVGSGYAQIIGPLVPAGVNEVSCLGNKGYEQLLGIRPRTV